MHCEFRVNKQMHRPVTKQTGEQKNRQTELLKFENERKARERKEKIKRRPARL